MIEKERIYLINIIIGIVLVLEGFILLFDDKNINAAIFLFIFSSLLLLFNIVGLTQKKITKAKKKVGFVPTYMKVKATPIFKKKFDIKKFLRFRK
jgi:hypothetical protein